MSRVNKQYFVDAAKGDTILVISERGEYESGISYYVFATVQDLFEHISDKRIVYRKGTFLSQQRYIGGHVYYWIPKRLHEEIQSLMQEKNKQCV